MVFPGASQQDTPRNLNKESYNHHEHALTAIAKAIERYLDGFPMPATTAWGIFAFNKQDGFVRSIFQQVEKHLQATGLTMSSAFYEEKSPIEITPPKGELVAFFNRSGSAELWLERTRVWPSLQSNSSSATALPGMSTTPVSLDTMTSDAR